MTYLGYWKITAEVDGNTYSWRDVVTNTHQQIRLASALMAVTECNLWIEFYSRENKLTFTFAREWVHP